MRLSAEFPVQRKSTLKMRSVMAHPGAALAAAQDFCRNFGCCGQGRRLAADLSPRLARSLELVERPTLAVARLLEHPFGIVGFGERRLGAEEGRIEADRLSEVVNGDVHVKALHDGGLLSLVILR